MKTTKSIKWKTILVDVSKIKPTPGNFKLRTEEGFARFNTSISKYGLAGTVILNTDFTLIDGNTRLEKAKELKQKKIAASMPDRKLTPKEFTEFAAMYDVARAGNPDLDRIMNEVGTTEDFFKDWNMPFPSEALNRLSELEANEAVVKINGVKKEEPKQEDFSMGKITLLLSKADAEEYIRIAESLYAKFKVDNIHDLSIKILRFVKKLK